MNPLHVLIAVLIGVVIWKLCMAVLRAVANPPPDLDPEDTVESRLRFRCSVCGAEVTMTAVNRSEARAPRHCREEMDEKPV